jgi:serine/threonine protein kinase/Tol biopolymer transport system component
VILEPGAVLGHYEIVALVGRGGMGDVYKARDTRLGRFVAVKVITAELADRDDARRRFEEECRLTATLDHPRICTVHDVGSQGGVLYLVMEFLDGTSLAQKMARGPLSRLQVVGYAIEIAGAIHYAHRRGVIHRDLKPANVFITSAGVKVLDFGIATLRHADAPVSSVAAAERTAAPRTAQGSVFGTPHYFPPERLEGKPADHRSDVFGFGAILYEMATGRRAFDAPTPAGRIAAILTAEPAPVPVESELADLNWVLKRCLAKDPDERWQSLGDVEATLKSMARTPGRTADPTAVASTGRTVLAVFAFLVALAVAAVAFGVYRARDLHSSNAAVTFTIQPPPGGTFTLTEGSVESAQLAISPDGRDVAFVASGADGVSQIWIRALGSIPPQPLPGTEGATYPFWSADGQSLGFFVKDELRRIDRRGGPSRRIARAPNGRGGTWNAEGVILFAPDSNGRLTRIRADGTGSADQTTVETDHGEICHRWPQFLPDGRHFLFFVRSSDVEKHGVYLGSLDSPERTMLVSSRSSAQYAPPGSLLYVVDGTLLAANLDIGRRRLTSDPIAVAPRVGTSSNFYSAVSVSAVGVLAYATRTEAPEELAWIKRSGERLATVATDPRYVDFRISPDARYLAMSKVAAGTDDSDISVLDMERGRTRRLTTSPATDASPVWAPDGTRMVFRSNRESNHDLYIRDSSGAGGDALFLKSGSAKYPTSWSRSGLIVYQTNNKDTRWDIFGVPWSRPTDAQLLVKSNKFNEVQGQVSPDERWLAYTSDESGLHEVYALPLKGPGRPTPISIHSAADPHWQGAADPRWRADGKELFYVTAAGTLMAVPLLPGGLEFGQPQPLFNIAHASIAPPYTSAYDPAPDGKRFLVRIRREDARTLPLTVVMNWTKR